MPLTEDDDRALVSRDDDEGLFSRDISGQLVRLDSPTESDYDKTVAVQIDGRSVTVPLAEPLTDSQGNIVLNIDGSTTPRYTTIYDAAVKLYSQQADGHAANPIPTLCHQLHMAPVAVCRLCVVQIYASKRGKRAAERKLLPACQHQVKEGMEIFTMNAPGKDGDRVRGVVKVMTELLAAEHLKPAPAPAPAAALAPFNELQRMAERCEVTGSRFKLNVLVDRAARSGPAPSQKGLDDTSPVFLVDHSACILCDRCSRACDEVKNNQVIGRTGKGPTAGIGFDLDTPMGDSTCVQCGECMVSCPTSAITFRPVAKVKLRGDADADLLPAAELTADPLFASVPPKFLLWQEGLVVRRRLHKDEVLCRQGDAGNTAFVIKKGRLQITAWPEEKAAKPTFLSRFTSRPKAVEPLQEFVCGPEQLMVGEMACLSGTPRSADVVSKEDGGEIWEVRRNVLDRIIRSPTQRKRVEDLYRSRALNMVLRSSDVFKNLPADEYDRCVEFLRPRLSFVRVSPGQRIFEQGIVADCLYLIRLGHVRVGVYRFGVEATVIHRGPGTAIGEIGLLALTADDAGRSVDQVNDRIADILKAPDAAGAWAAIPAGRRTATCTALDHVELARVDRRDFLQMIRDFPPLRRRFIELSLGRLSNDNDNRPAMREYIEQGLYQGQSLLVLDLDKCTRCDECTRACVDQHGSSSHGVPITRMLRDGLRFGHNLVATACRSCKDAYCMIGCPVDAIHRGKHLQIVIEDHCIGCGLCEKNCPFGNIWMPENEAPAAAFGDPGSGGDPRRAARPKAAACDLCDADGLRDEPLPRCVHACPHDAAHRMTGEQLLNEVCKR